MTPLVKSFSDFITEEEHPDFPGMQRHEIEDLQSVGAIQQKPLYQRFSEFRRNFENDSDINDAIDAFNQAAKRYFERTFSGDKGKELNNFIWHDRNEANDTEDNVPLGDRTWFQWWLTH